MNPQTRHDAPIEDLLKELYVQAKKQYTPLNNILDNDTLKQSLQPWLARLSHMKDYNCNEKRKQWLINNVITYLEFANADESFRWVFGEIIYEAVLTCGDRIALSLLHLGIAHKLATIDLHEMKKLADFLKRGVWAMSLLETIARERISTLRLVDQIEVYLAYPVMLKGRLQLPIDVEEMLYFTSSYITEIDLDNAYDFVTEQLANKENFYQFLVNQDRWRASLALNYPEQLANIITKKNDLTAKTSPDGDFNLITAIYTQDLVALTTIALDEVNEAAASSS